FFPWAIVYGKANTLAQELPAEKRAAVTAELLPASLPAVPGTETQAIEPAVAYQFACISMIDLLVFFGVLLVGFAYLWKRGDIDWVRSITAERVAGETAGMTAPPLPAAEQQRPLVGAGS